MVRRGYPAEFTIRLLGQMLNMSNTGSILFYGDTIMDREGRTVVEMITLFGMLILSVFYFQLSNWNFQHCFLCLRFTKLQPEQIEREKNGAVMATDHQMAATSFMNNAIRQCHQLLLYI